MGGDIRRFRSGIADLAFTIRPSKEPGGAGLRVCIEHCYVLMEMLEEKQSTIGLLSELCCELRRSREGR
jgi:hypothetical protein